MFIIIILIINMKYQPPSCKSDIQWADQWPRGKRLERFVENWN